MTGRLPFNPEKMKRRVRGGAAQRSEPGSGSGSAAGRPGAGAASRGDAPWTVHRLASEIGGALSAAFPAAVRVAGEVSGFRDRTHWYFDLKDEHAVVNCVCFASAARRCARIADGDEVIVRGRVEHYAPQGKLSLVVDRIEPVGAGRLDAEYRRLVGELRLLGWFDVERKRPLPAFPRRVCVITSRTAAALQDIIDTARRRCPAVDIVHIDSRVQGAGAAAEVAAALRLANARREGLGIDAVLITRGGGSMEDLWAFNDRALAEQILTSDLPVVCAIGHETDTTIAELVADERCATPTQAAMRLVPDAASLREQAVMIERRLTALLTQSAARARHRAEAVGRRRPFVAPLAVAQPHRDRAERAGRDLHGSAGTRLSRARSRVAEAAALLERNRPGALHALRVRAADRLEDRLASALRRRIDRARNQARRAQDRLHPAVRVGFERQRTATDAIERELHAVGPLQVLARGYSLTLGPNGALARDAARLSPGDEITTVLASGRVSSRVTGGVESAGGGARGGQEGSAEAGKAEGEAKSASPAPARRRRRRGEGRGRSGRGQMDLFGP